MLRGPAGPGGECSGVTAPSSAENVATFTSRTKAGPRGATPLDRAHRHRPPVPWGPPLRSRYRQQPRKPTVSSTAAARQTGDSIARPVFASYTLSLIAAMPVPPHILGAASDRTGGRWVLVIGAGCSVEPPTSLPDSATCARDAHRRLRSDGLLPQDCTNPDDLSAVADAVYAETQAQAPLVERLPLESFRSASPNQGHYTAAALLIERSLAGIVTLNFDLAMSTALANLGSGDAVAIVTGPNHIARLGNPNLVYLHRNADAPPEEWVLRSTHLEEVWEDRWEPVIATRILVSPVVVFVGIGSPAAVLTSTVTRIRTALPQAGVRVYQVDPVPFVEQPFAEALLLEEAAYYQSGWCDFMDTIASRVLSEHVALLQQACRDLRDERNYQEHNLEDVTTAIESLDLHVFGRIRARWLLHVGNYAAIHAFDTGLIADILLIISFLASSLVASVRLRDDGAIEFRRNGHLLVVVGLATGRGVRSLLAVEATLAEQTTWSPWQEPIPGRVLVTGYVRGEHTPTAPLSIVEDEDEHNIANPHASVQLSCAYELRHSQDVLAALTN